MIISKDQALAILKEHGIKDGNTPTEIIAATGESVADSTFFATFGECLEYELEKIMQWLGY
jgi:hypothetical protein